MLLALMIMMVLLYIYVSQNKNNQAIVLNKNNPYGNPLPYGSTTPEPTTVKDHSLDRLFMGTDEASLDWFMNPIPDPTLRARPVFWNFDPRPSEISSEVNCSYRNCK
jgi:hypothetical protein